jgi:hypothetical protein
MVFLLHFFFALSGFFTPAEKALPAPHPFYVSVTEINQNSAEKSLEVSCKFFLDDFEETLRNAYKVKLDILSDKEKASFDRLIPDYINKRLALVADGRPLALSYIGYERDKESVYCYFEVLNAPAVKQLQVNNSLLHDFKNEQINIMHVTINGKRQSTKLDFPSRQASFQFN